MGLEDLPVLDLENEDFKAPSDFIKLRVFEHAEICTSFENPDDVGKDYAEINKDKVTKQNRLRYVAGITMIGGKPYLVFDSDANTQGGREYICFKRDLLAVHSCSRESIETYNVKK